MEDIQQRYRDAVETLGEKLEVDHNILTFIVQGSLAYDKVWQKSDVDAMIIVKDQKLPKHEYTCVEDGVIINIRVFNKSDFRKSFERGLGGGMTASMMSKSKVIFTRDDTIYDVIEEMKVIGERDQELVLLSNMAWVLGLVEKVEKWLIVKHNPTYAQYYVLKTADAVGNIEVLRHGEVPDREAVLRAYELNPDLIKPIYQDMLYGERSEEQLFAVVQRIYDYLEQHTNLFCAQLFEYLSDNEPRTISEMEHALGRFSWLNGHGLVHICEYLHERGLLDKLSKTIRITPKGRMNIEEVCYVLIPSV